MDSPEGDKQAGGLARYIPTPFANKLIALLIFAPPALWKAVLLWPHVLGLGNKPKAELALWAYLTASWLAIAILLALVINLASAINQGKHYKESAYHHPKKPFKYGWFLSGMVLFWVFIFFLNS